MLTPPSAHRQVLLKHAPLSGHDSTRASDRREAELAAQLEKERARGLAARRDQINLAQQERDAYLANVQVLFKMRPPVKPLGAQQRAPPTTKCTSASKLAAWSEVSTAAPSSAGAEDDDELCTDPPLSPPIPVHRATKSEQVDPPCLDLCDSLEGPLTVAANSTRNDSPSPQEFAHVLGRIDHDKVPSASSRPPPLQPRDPAVFAPARRAAVGGNNVVVAPSQSTASASSSTAPKLEKRRAASASPALNTNAERRETSHSHIRAVQSDQDSKEALQPSRVVPPSALKAISAEEEALERSLLLMDFGEMRRQFAGQEPLWKKEALDKSFEMQSALGATRHEEKIKASLERLDGVIGSLRDELARKEEEEAAKAELVRREAEVSRVRCPSRERPPPSRGCGRPCSGATTSGSRRTRASSAGSYGRRGVTEKVVPPVARISAPPCDKSVQGRSARCATQEAQSEGTNVVAHSRAAAPNQQVRRKN